MIKILVSLKTGRTIRLDYSSEDLAEGSIKEFANQSGVVQVEDNFSEYIFYAKDIEFVKITENNDKQILKKEGLL